MITKKNRLVVVVFLAYYRLRDILTKVMHFINKVFLTFRII